MSPETYAQLTGSNHLTKLAHSSSTHRRAASPERALVIKVKSEIHNNHDQNLHLHHHQPKDGPHELIYLDICLACFSHKKERSLLTSTLKTIYVKYCNT